MHGTGAGKQQAGLRADAQQAAQQEEVDLEFGVHVRQRTHLAQHLPYQPVRARQRRVHLRAPPRPSRLSCLRLLDIAVGRRPWQPVPTLY